MRRDILFRGALGLWGFWIPIGGLLLSALSLAPVSPSSFFILFFLLCVYSQRLWLVCCADRIHQIPHYGMKWCEEEQQTGEENVPRLKSRTSWAYDWPLWPPKMNRYEPTWVEVWERRLCLTSVITVVHIKFSVDQPSSLSTLIHSTFSSPSPLYPSLLSLSLWDPKTEEDHSLKFNTWTSAKLACPSLPPKTIILSPTKLAVW